MFPGGKDTDGGQELLVGCVDVLVDDGGIKEVAVELLDPTGLLGTAVIVILLCVGVCVCVCGGRGG